MFKSIAGVAGLVLLMSSSNAFAALSLAYIQQLDTTAFHSRDPLVTTQEIFGAAKQTLDTLATMAPDTGNLGWIDQVGDNNLTSLLQTGDGNVGFIQIMGSNNIASLEQTGSRNIGFIQQVGAYNSAMMQQTGSGHMGAIVQQGNGNVAILRQR